MFIVVTSNAFAVLGLRALYFVLAGAMERFAFLSTGLAVLLAFIGAKMLLAGIVHIPVAVSLAVIVVVITSAVLLSVWQQRRRPAADLPHHLQTPHAGPAYQPALLGPAPRPVATEDKHDGAADSADATARMRL